GPYYLLAHEALRSRNFQECDRLSDLALQRNPRAEIRAVLLSWKAISRWHLGVNKPRQIRKLFEEARRLKTDDVLIARYAQAFRDDEKTLRAPSSLQFEDGEPWREQAEQYVNEVWSKQIKGMRPNLDASLM